MAKARAICTCKICGTTFEVTKTCSNRRGANSYEEWAKDHFDLCYDCKKLEKEEKLRESGVGVTVKAIGKSPNIKVAIILEGDTRRQKEVIKDLGYIWTELECFDDLLKESNLQDLFNLAMYGPKMYWAKVFEQYNDETIKAEIEKLTTSLERINKVLDCFIDEEYRMMYETYINKMEENRNKAQEQLKILKHPVAPDFYDTSKRWNGKIYGRSGRYAIYQDGEKISITDEQKNVLESYVADMDIYKIKKAEIERKYL